MADEEKKYKITFGNLYELNKQAMLTHPEISEDELKEVKDKIKDWFNWRIDGYAMLLCRQRYDFTIFHLYQNENPNPPQVATAELIEVLKTRGTILSIEKDSNVVNDAWEIWLKIGDDTFAYYLFCCDDWVIEC